MYSENPVAGGLQPWEQALLNTIAGDESAGKYNIRYTPKGGATFDLNGQHPAIFEPTSDGRKSSAAGRYQFTKTTWDGLPEEAKGDGSFSPENQDRAALWLARNDFNRRTGQNLDDILQNQGMTPEVVKALAPTWEAFAKNDPSKYVNMFSKNLSNPGVGGGGSDPAVAGDAANKPAPRALTAQFQGKPNTPEGFSVPGQPPVEPSIWDKLQSGGPGALFGKPQTGWNIGDTLTNVGIAMMARDKPEAAAALSRTMLAQNSANTKAQGKVEKPEYDTKTGQMIVGGRAMPIPGWQKPAPEIKDSTYKSYDKYRGQADSLYGTVTQGNQVLGALADNTLDVSIWNKPGATVRGWLGMSNPNDVNLTALQQYIKGAQQAFINNEAGVATNDDAKRALDSIASGEALTDKRRLAAALQKVNGAFETSFKRNADLTASLQKKYGADLDPEGAFGTELENRREALRMSNERLSPRLKTILESQAPGGSATPTQGSQTAPTVRPGRGSIQRDEDGTIRHPSGVVIRPR